MSSEPEIQNSSQNEYTIHQGLILLADELNINHPNIFKYLTEQLQIGILIVDADFNMVYSNPFFCEMLGYRSAELMGKHIFTPMDEEGRAIVLGYMERRRQGVSETHPFTWLKKNGDKIHTSIHTTPILNRKSGQFTGAIGLIHDVTKESRTIERLRVNEGRYRALEQFARSFSWEVDCNGLFTFVSQNVQELIGYAPEEICHKMHFYDLCPEFYRDGLHREAFEIMQQQEAFRNTINPILTKNKMIMWVRTNGMPVYDLQGNWTGYRGTDTDITESHILGSQLLEATEEVEALRRRALLAREDERATLARELHDQFGQSLTAIRYNLEWLAGQNMLSTESSERIHRLTEVVQQNIKMVQQYAYDLRPIELQEKGLADSIKEFCERFWIDTGIRSDHQIDQPGTIDENRQLALYRILQEALTNVARHAGATKVKITLTCTETHVHLTIADNGKGIPAEKLHCKKAIGLIGMKERVGYFGGDLQIRVNGGTHVEAVIPLPVSKLHGAK